MFKRSVITHNTGSDNCVQAAGHTVHYSLGISGCVLVQPEKIMLQTLEEESFVEILFKTASI